MDTPTSSGTDRDSEDALKVLGRVADAFDNPGSLHKMDKEVLFVVNVVKSRHLLSSLSSEDSVCQDAMCGSYDSSFDTSYDGDVEVVELGDVSKWEHANKIFRQDDGMYDVTKMLLASSPLDRLDRVARMELKKTDWFERTDKWSVVQLGLPGLPPASTPPKTPPKNAVRSRELSSTTSPSGEKHISRSPGRGVCTTEGKQKQGGAIKFSTATSPDLNDYSALSYADASKLSRWDTMTSIRTSRTLLDSQTLGQPTRGRLGRVMRDFVKKMLPPSGDGRAIERVNSKGAWDSRRPPGRTWREDLTPRSDVSGATSRWSGFWN